MKALARRAGEPIEELVERRVDERSTNGPITIYLDVEVVLAYEHDHRPEWAILLELVTLEGFIDRGEDMMSRRLWWRIRPGTPAADLLRRFYAGGVEPKKTTWGHAGRAR